MKPISLKNLIFLSFKNNLETYIKEKYANEFKILMIIHSNTNKEEEITEKNVVLSPKRTNLYITIKWIVFIDKFSITLNNRYEIISISKKINKSIISYNFQTLHNNQNNIDEYIELFLEIINSDEVD